MWSGCAGDCRRGTVEELRRNLAASLAERIARAELTRQAWWMESLAVSGLEFVKQDRTADSLTQGDEHCGPPRSHLDLTANPRQLTAQEMGLKNVAED